MKTTVLAASLGAAAAVLAGGVIWAAPSASAGSDFCNSLPASQARECNCGFDNIPGSQEYQQCLHGNAVAPPPASPAPAQPAPVPPG